MALYHLAFARESPSQAISPPAKLSSGEAFVWLDRALDRATSGPLFLKQDEIAEIVVDSLFKGVELGHYELGAFVVMPNHVHALILPLISPSMLLKSLKGFTAREANKVLGRTGEPFWQRESYDHWVRNGEEYNRIKQYIENNPVKAGLASTPVDYCWSGAHSKWESRLRASTKSAFTGV